MAAVLVAIFRRDRPYQAAAAMAAGALNLRLFGLHLPHTDPLANAWYASQRAFSGFDPYGAHMYPNGSVYAYGPFGSAYVSPRHSR